MANTNNTTKPKVKKPKVAKRPRRKTSQIDMIAEATVYCLGGGPMSAGKLASEIATATHENAASPTRRKTAFGPSIPRRHVSYDACREVGREVGAGGEDALLEVLDLKRHLERGGSVARYAARLRTRPRPQATIEPDPRSMLPVLRFLRRLGLVEGVGERRGAKWRLCWWWLPAQVAIHGIREALVFEPLSAEFVG